MDGFTNYGETKVTFTQNATRNGEINIGYPHQEIHHLNNFVQINVNNNQNYFNDNNLEFQPFIGDSAINSPANFPPLPCMHNFTSIPQASVQNVPLTHFPQYNPSTFNTDAMQIHPCLYTNNLNSNGPPIPLYSQMADIYPNQNVQMMNQNGQMINQNAINFTERAEIINNINYDVNYNEGIKKFDEQLNYFLKEINRVDEIKPKQHSKYINSIQYETGKTVKGLNAKNIDKENSSEMINIAMKGCEIAEHLANKHQSRPCFKKIDNLCSRMKQDLIHPINLIPNINSQGVPWAVKDFIFVFTRIINAWVIIKGYTNNNDEINHIKTALSSNFLKSFNEWQESTKNFIQDLIKSFTNLDKIIIHQKTDIELKNLNHKNNINNNENELNFKIIKKSLNILNDLSSSNESISKLSFDDYSSDSSNNKNYNSSLSDYSEEMTKMKELNKNYIKIGTYNSLSKDLTQLPVNKAPKLVDSFKNPLPLENIANNINFNSNNNDTQINNKNFNIDNNGEGDGNYIINNNFADNTLKLLQYDINQIKYSNFNAIQATQQNKSNYRLDKFIYRISNMTSGKYFILSQFTKNYFPDFIAQFPNFLDIRSIILRAQSGVYYNIEQMVQDLKLIIYNAKIHLETYNNELLKQSIKDFEFEIESILKET